MSLSPSISSIGGTPSLEASRRASAVNVPVVMRIPLSARPAIAPRKSRACDADTDSLYRLHWKSTLKDTSGLTWRVPYPSIPRSPDRPVTMTCVKPASRRIRWQSCSNPAAGRPCMISSTAVRWSFRGASCCLSDLLRQRFRRDDPRLALLLENTNPLEENLPRGLECEMSSSTALGQAPDTSSRGVDQSFTHQVEPSPRDLISEAGLTRRQKLILKIIRQPEVGRDLLDHFVRCTGSPEAAEGIQQRTKISYKLGAFLRILLGHGNVPSESPAMPSHHWRSKPNTTLRDACENGLC